tara:strand:+ start:470 stop:604 length:135 start_codon:yes stop_codon:yes gene_type:complete
MGSILGVVADRKASYLWLFSQGCKGIAEVTEKVRKADIMMAPDE